MCGRFTLTSRPEEIAETFDLDSTPDLAPRYNLAPGQDVATVDAASGSRALCLRRWGLVPSFAKDPAVGNRMINARAETAAERPAFRDSFRRRRCLVPADGFYEWAGARAPRQAWHIHLPGRELFAFAGLFERWRDPAGEVLESCAILTTEANAKVRSLHERMPVILPREAWARWLDLELGDPASLAALLAPWPAERTDLGPVGLRVNDPRVDDVACLAPAPPEPLQGRLL